MADETNDSHDHDELHAAGSIVLMLFTHKIMPPHYIRRWIEGLLDEDQG
jgi:hypothetical protein